ncbi:MAG: hypothetical protein DMD34_12260 [Gemmatimonadetes bacterium]|nr:MAG: hypothetical protein DMD34_12260 [Gemmatimonadota bacterium]
MSGVGCRVSGRGGRGPGTRHPAPFLRAGKGSWGGGLGQGRFIRTINGRAIFVRFIFSDITPTSFRLEQAFSEDGGMSLGRCRGGGLKVAECCRFPGDTPILWRFYAGFRMSPRETGVFPRVFTTLDPHKETP